MCVVCGVKGVCGVEGVRSSLVHCLTADPLKHFTPLVTFRGTKVS